MIAGPIFFDELYIDLSFIFLFCAAAALKRHSRTARKWVLTLLGVALAIAFAMPLWAAFFGTTGMTISVGRWHTSSPALWQVVAVATPIFVVVGVPFFVLLSARARRQFGGGAGRFA